MSYNGAVNPQTAAPTSSLLEPHVIVCGLGRFGLRLVELLCEKHVPVVIITDRTTRADRISQALVLGASVVEGDFRFPEVREAARVDESRAFILATSDDRANLETALDARSEAPSARIVMRLDADRIAARLSADFDIDAVLSPPLLAAHAFTLAALQPPPESLARPMRVLSGLPGLRRRPVRASPIPVLLLVTLVLLFVSGVVVFRAALGLTWVDAVYFTATIITTVGFGDYHLREEPANVKLFGTLMMFGGVILIAVTSSFVTNFFLSGAATQLRAERHAARYKKHLILCGLGSVGYAIAKDLLSQRIPFVVIDATPDDLHARDIAGRVPLLIGDATDPETLIKAGFDRARAVVVSVSNDATNLEVALLAQSLAEERRPARPVRIVLRCFDPDLARRIHARSEAYTLLSSAEIAAPIFVEQALG